MEDDDDVEHLEALLDAAGFAPPPADITGMVEASLDVARLRQHLVEVVTGSTCGGIERESELRTEHSERESLRSCCEDVIGARDRV